MKRRFVGRKGAVVGGKESLAAISGEMAEPMRKALDATDAGDLLTALKYFGDCAAIDPLNKAVLYFGSDAAQRAYFNLKHQDPPPTPEQVAGWRSAALALTQAAAEADPEDPVPSHNVGRFIQDDGDDAGSIPWYRDALALDNTLVESYGNLGTALYTMGDTKGAELAWSKCVAFDAKNASGRLAQAYVWLRREQWTEGWTALNARWADASFMANYGRKDIHGKMWTGQPLTKKQALLVHGEQGLGDHVQFARYIRTLQQVDIPIAAIETRAPLKTWMEACFPTIPIVLRDGEAPPFYTHHAPMISLPGILHESAPIGPIAPPALIRTRTTLPTTGKVRVGIVWYGTAGNQADAIRSLPSEALAGLADLAGIEWVPLQFDPHGMAELTAKAWLGASVADAPVYTDVLGLGQAMLDCDAVVSVDTLACHVAGSVGIPTFVLHRFNREWRWNQHNTRTPWYASHTLVTQPAPNDWAGCIAACRTQLEAWVATKDAV